MDERCIKEPCDSAVPHRIADPGSEIPVALLEPGTGYSDSMQLEDLVQALDRAAVRVKCTHSFSSIAEGDGAAMEEVNSSRGGRMKISSGSGRTATSNGVKIQRRPLLEVGRDELARRTVTAVSAMNASAGGTSRLSSSKDTTNSTKETDGSTKIKPSLIYTCKDPPPSDGSRVDNGGGDENDEQSPCHNHDESCDPHPSPPGTSNCLFHAIRCDTEPMGDSCGGDGCDVSVAPTSLSAVGSPQPASLLGAPQGSTRDPTYYAPISPGPFSVPPNKGRGNAFKRRRPMLRYFAMLFYPVALLTLHWGVETAYQRCRDAPPSAHKYVQSFQAMLAPHAPKSTYSLLHYPARLPDRLTRGGADRHTTPLHPLTPEQVAAPLSHLVHPSDGSGAVVSSKPLSWSPQALLVKVRAAISRHIEASSQSRPMELDDSEDEQRDKAIGIELQASVVAWSRDVIHTLLHPLPPGSSVREALLEGAL